MAGVRLGVAEREEIALGLAHGLSLRAIACELRARPAESVEADAPGDHRHARLTTSAY